MEDWKILCKVATAMGSDGFRFETASDVFEEIRKTTPSYRGINYKRIEKDGIQWPCPTEEHPGTKFLHKGIFPKGKGLMQGISYKEPAELASEDYPILLSTGRMIYHYNVMTRYSDNLDDIRPYELAELNPREAKELGVKDKDVIRVTSRRGSILTRVVVTDKVKPGMMFMTFHYRESPVNELTNAAYDPITLTAEYKITAVKIEKASEEEALSL